MKIEKMQEKKTIPVKEIVISIIVILLMSAAIGGVTYFLNKPVSEMIRNIISFLWGCFITIFLWYQSKVQQNLEYDNASHPLRFLVVFILCFGVSLGMVFAPVSSWMFLAIMVVLAMFSNTVIGLTGGSVLLLLTTTLSDSGNMYIFFLYFMVGLIGVSLFRNLGLDFQVTGPLVLSGISSFVLQTAYIVIFENQPFIFESILMPLLNLFINMVLLFLILKYFSGSSMYLLQDKYSDINDQEFPVMSDLKKHNKELYLEAIHTAYFGERIARKLEINHKAVKGCCYYYKIADAKVITGNNSVLISEYYEFPQDLTDLIEECNRENYSSKESCVVLTSNKLVRCIMENLDKYPKGKLPYEKLISGIFLDMMQSTMLDDCDISMKELNLMKKTFVEEHLYYDFLRRK